MHSRGAYFLPASVDWRAVFEDPSRPIVFVNRFEAAESLCRAGQPAIAAVGISRRNLVRWLRKQGANVIEKHQRQ